MKTKDEKRRKPRYGYYGLPKFSILITTIIFIGALGKFLMIEPLRSLRNFFFGWTPLGVWMLLHKDAWAKLLKNTGFTNLDYIYENGSGIFLVEKPRI